MKKKWIFFFLALLTALHITLLFTHKTFIYKALIYTYPDIDDQDLFYSRVSKRSSNRQAWPISKHFNKQPLPDTLEKTLENLESTAFLVIKNDSILIEKYYNNSSDTSISGSFSVAKSFIVTLIGIAIDKGYIKNIDEPIATYLPEFSKDGKEKITIRHCLMMSSGLNWDEAYASAFSVTTEAYYGTDLAGTINRLSVIEEPGKYFSYKSGDTQILSLVLSKATGKSTTQFMQDELWDRIGSEQDALWNLDDINGTEKAYCCIYSTARDFARLGKLYLHDGIWGEEQVVSKGFIEIATTANRLIDKATLKINYNYGLHWWLYPNNFHKKVFYARGILGQYIIVIPDEQLVIVRLGHKRGEKIEGHPSEFLQIVDLALKGTW